VLDGGRTFAEFPGNPAVKHEGRDPKLLWHEPTRQWVMAVYDEHDKKQWIAFHTSPDLKRWTFRSRTEGYYECPDLIELPLDGDPQRKHWILYGADGKYALGAFDGAKFTPAGPKHALWHGNFYAAQTYSNAPRGRCVQIGWGRDTNMPGMPFNQQMCLPCELTLRNTPAGPRLHAWPVPEFDGLAKEAPTAATHADRIDGIGSEAYDLTWTFPAPKGSRAKLVAGGVEIGYDADRRVLRCGAVEAPVEPRNGAVALRVVLDRASLEIFAQQGAAALSVAIRPDPMNRIVTWKVDGAGASPVPAPALRELPSAWDQ
jgi:fructan beta-fructosidase